MAVDVIVYRVVDENGYGMYGGRVVPVAASLWSLATQAAFDELAHPVPDRILRTVHFREQKYQFAFRSLEQLRDWISVDDWILRMGEFGGILQTISVSVDADNPLLFDKGQCAFAVAMSTIICSQNIAKFFFGREWKEYL